MDPEAVLDWRKNLAATGFRSPDRPARSKFYTDCRIPVHTSIGSCLLYHIQALTEIKKITIFTFSSPSASSLGDQAERNLLLKYTNTADVKRKGILCNIVRESSLMFNNVCSAGLCAVTVHNRKVFWLMGHHVQLDWHLNV